MVYSRSFADEAFPIHLLKCLERLRREEMLCDVRIVCGKEKIMAHKVVLAAASNYFCAMFTSGMSESELSEVGESLIFTVFC